jgi:hypothetical protein
MNALTKHMFSWSRFHAACLAAVLALPVSFGAALPAYSFTPSSQERDLYLLIRADGEQRRVQVVLDPRLCNAARKHAADTQRRKFFAHKNPDGVNPNQRVINEGYPLPAHYAANQNYVESMAGSVVDTAADALKLWRGSPSHATHVFGKDAFYREQVVLGVGRAPASGHGYATYVFISAPGPVGQTWSATARVMRRAQVVIDTTGMVTLSSLQPQTILEIWTSPTLQAWAFQQTIVVGPGGSADVGLRSVPRGFFRMGYYQP